MDLWKQKKNKTFYSAAHVDRNYRGINSISQYEGLVKNPSTLSTCTAKFFALDGLKNAPKCGMHDAQTWYFRHIKHEDGN